MIIETVVQGHRNVPYATVALCYRDWVIYTCAHTVRMQISVQWIRILKSDSVLVFAFEVA
jgi:hypothetical protein